MLYNRLLGENDEAGGVAIQTRYGMYTGINAVGFIICLYIIVERCASLADGGVYQHACRLIDNQQKIVLVSQHGW